MVRYLGPYPDRVQRLELLVDLPRRARLRARTHFGFAQRALLNFADATQPNNVGQQGGDRSLPTAQRSAAPEFLHGQPYGAAIDTQGNADCETGQRGYPKQLNYFDPQHRNLATDPHTPGNQGPTFSGSPASPPARPSAATR